MKDGRDALADAFSRFGFRLMVQESELKSAVAELMQHLQPFYVLPQGRPSEASREDHGSISKVLRVETEAKKALAEAIRVVFEEIDVTRARIAGNPGPPAARKSPGGDAR